MQHIVGVLGFNVGHAGRKRNEMLHGGGPAAVGFLFDKGSAADLQGIFQSAVDIKAFFHILYSSF